MSRKSSRFSSAPIAPFRAPLLQRWSAARSGRHDARNHRGIADGTFTQALNELQTRAQHGQHDVNRWYSKQAEPILQGNSRIKIQLDQLQAEIDELTARPGESGRIQKANSKRMESLSGRKVSQLSQLDMNNESLIALKRQAVEAMDSWEKYFAALASIYVRSLSKKLNRDVRSSDAEIPPFQKVPMIDLDEN